MNNKCPECSHELTHEREYPETKHAPAEPERIYCKNCGWEDSLEPEE